MGSSTTNTPTTRDGPKRTYYRRSESSGRGVGMYPKDVVGRSGKCCWSRKGTEPYATVPEVREDMTLHRLRIEDGAAS